jgi:ATPase subunit of ABC transporter with duplicated ATPase domains
MPRALLGSMKDHAERTGGENAWLAERRRSQALEEAAAARERIEVLQPLSVVLPPTGLPVGRMILRIDTVSAGYAPAHPIIRDLSLTITGPERIAVTGPNGSGKTTLLALAAGQLKPWTGTVRLMADVAALDQRASLLDPSTSIRDNFRRVNPLADENAYRAALARFMLRADAALPTVSRLSGGQLQRAGLACVLGAKPPALLILDEPTNHLDIDSIEAVEAGLRAYDGPLLVVSHDAAFLQAIGISRRLELRRGQPAETRSAISRDVDQGDVDLLRRHPSPASKKTASGWPEPEAVSRCCRKPSQLTLRLDPELHATIKGIARIVAPGADHRLARADAGRGHAARQCRRQGGQPCLDRLRALRRQPLVHVGSA